MPELIPDFDLYAELELDASAGTAEIEAAWRRLMRRSHPDVGPAGSVDRSVRLNVAHDWLTDQERRARYDADRAARQRRAEAVARRRKAAARAAGGRPAAPQQRGSVQPARPRTVRQRPPLRMARRPRTGLGGHLLGMAAGAGLVVVVLVIALGLAGGLGPDRLAATASPTPAGDAVPSAAPSAPSPTPSPTPSSVPSPAPTPTPSPTAPATPSPSPAPTLAPSPPVGLSVPAIVGNGTRDAIPLVLSAGTYAVTYAITGPADATCSWVLWLREASSDGESLAASAYPLPGETVHDTETEAFVAAGPATARVESDCPRWSFSMTWTGP